MPERTTGLGEDGNLMVMTLMVLLVLTVLGTAILGVAGMENKVSHYGVEILQAQQAADAGVDWAVEEIWEQGLPETFIEQLNLDNGISSAVEVTEKSLLDIGAEDNNGNNNGNNGNHGEGNNGNGNGNNNGNNGNGNGNNNGNNGNHGEGNNGNGNGNNGNGNGNGNGNNLGLNECTYKLISTGVYHGVTRKLEVEVVYRFSEIYPLSYDSIEIKSYKVIP